MLRIENGRVIDPATGVDEICALNIADGKILGRGKVPENFTPEQTIDASGLIVCPGLIDLAARVREPGLEHKATIQSESRAAASAGITTLCVPPDTNPVIDTPAVAEWIESEAHTSGFARLLPIGALTQGLDGARLSEMAELKQAGCIGVSNARNPIANNLVARRTLEYAATHDLTLFIEADDQSLSNGGCAHEGRVSTRLGLPGIPEAAETLAVATYLLLARQTGARVHFGRLSSAAAARMIKQAQDDNLKVSADVSAHQLHLTEMDIGEFDSACHLLPPLRTQTDREGLRQALASNSIGAICSDHQPHEPDAKLAPFADTEPGISALETLLPLALGMVQEGVMTINQAIARLTQGPADILGLDLGSLGPGMTADVCVFDPDACWTPGVDNWVSRGLNSPYMGRPLHGRVIFTVMNGTLVFDRNA